MEQVGASGIVLRMSDRIFIEGLLLHGSHGLRARERRESQDFLVDISVAFDTVAAGASDKIKDTFDYGHLREVAKQVFAGTSCYLIERVASKIAAEILLDRRVAEVTVTIRKPHVYPDCVPGVSITRRSPFSV